MSALAIIFNRDGKPVDAKPLWSMLQAVPYRGPDGSAVRLMENVGFGHAKMAVTPQDALDEQPIVSRKSGASIIADVRLDNRDELFKLLSDPPSADASDAALILSAYEHWGTECVARLLGDFAFAIWDPRHQRLVCARDSSAQRALFYRVDSHTFAAASEIHQLLLDPSVPIEPNHERIRDYLTPFYMFKNEKDHAQSFYKGIFSVPAGHFMVVTGTHQQTTQFWSIDGTKEIRYRRDEEYDEHFRSLFFDVVKARLRTTYPTGALLSGGLDSSTVVCSAQELLLGGQVPDNGFTSFNLSYGDLDCDEGPLVRDIAAKYDIPVEYVPCGVRGGRLQLEPSGFLESPNMGNAELRDSILASANAKGVRTVLTGDIADSCVGGSRLVFDSLLRHGKIRELLHHFGVYRRLSEESTAKVVALACLAPMLPLPVQRAVMAAYAARLMRRDADKISPGWMPESLRAELSGRHGRLWIEAERSRPFSSPARYEEYSMLYPAESARHPAPWSIEFWRPFADRRLHSFLLAIPPEQKFSPHPESDHFYSGSKQIVRRSMKGILPESIRTRVPKTYFTSAVEMEVETAWPDYLKVFGPEGESEIARHGYVDGKKFWERLQSLRGGETGPDFMYVMSMVQLETWLRSLSQPRERLSAVPPVWQRAEHSLTAAAR